LFQYKISVRKGVNPKDIEGIATVMLEQHGQSAEDFVRRMMHFYRETPSVTATWKAVLAALIWKRATPDYGFAKTGDFRVGRRHRGL
jgi:hypothetical protein